MMLSGDQNVQLDEKRLNRLKVRILTLEQENLRTRADTADQLIDKIRKIIEEEVKKCF